MSTDAKGLDGAAAVETHGLVRRFGEFVAVDGIDPDEDWLDA